MKILKKIICICLVAILAAGLFSRCTDRGLCSWKAGTVSIL
ncbi:MAG: hypothetical protein ACLRP8_17915 [Roseburia intestinalis]